MPNVRLEGVSKFFGRVKALEDIDLEIFDGEYLCIIGPSGCGKTTLINCITGIVDPTHGKISFDGEIIDLPIEKREFAMVFQSIALFPHMTAEQNVTYGPFVADLTREQQKETGNEMLELVDLLEQKKLYPRFQSGGAQQKTALARALATKEKLLILDEPISALDYKVRVTLRYEIQRLVKKLGLTAVHITHDQEEAISIADRIIIMRAGKIVETGSPQQLYERPATLFTMNFVGESNFLEGVIEHKFADDSYQFEFRNHQTLDLKGIEGYFEQGESIVMAFRPETVEISYEDETNTLLGTVMQKRFMGGYFRYEIELLSEDLIIIDSHEMLNKKEKIFIEFEPEKTRLFKSPKFGLRKVLALE